MVSAVVMERKAAVVLELSGGPDPEEPYDPFAAFVRLRLTNPRNPVETRLIEHALIDPGSDILSAPLEIGEQFDLDLNEDVGRSFIYRVQVGLPQFNITCNTYIEFDDGLEVVLIGRETLLDLRLLFMIDMKNHWFNLKPSS